MVFIFILICSSAHVCRLPKAKLITKTKAQSLEVWLDWFFLLKSITHVHEKVFHLAKKTVYGTEWSTLRIVRIAGKTKKYEKHEKREGGVVLNIGQNRCCDKKARKAPKAPRRMGGGAWFAFHYSYTMIELCFVVE